ncbi:multiple epidermal growth factor-like domains 10 [Plakobranchus ocellatus]|uniref:Multiple epidermal growth factor-like domains 10 n=1 Tax=Plakobranchus ocellatus TaxID=259542 RepID=A0AAV4C704_9GAST|nr:multiple epidermal growth factor-like domains 10 [Plakobranchus ocellatus]
MDVRSYNKIGFKIFILFLLCAPRVYVAQSQSCDQGWFGDECQFQCHCAVNTGCDPSNGICSAGCDPQWFGPACQYAVSELKVTSWSNLAWLKDNDDTTCNERNVQPLTVELVTPHPLTWVRIVVRDTANLTGFQLSYHTSTPGTSVPCTNPRSARVNDKILDIFCPTPDVVSYVTLSGRGVSGLCSLYISGGRNVALKQKTEQSSLYQGWYANKAVDGNPSGRGIDFNHTATCSHTSDAKNASSPGWWTVTFSNNVEINRLIIYNRRDGCCRNRLVNFTLQVISSSGSKLVYNYTQPGGSAQLVYIVVPSPMIQSPVESVRFDVSKNTGTNIMTLCEVFAFGDVVCSSGKFGRECEHDCNCANQTEACFVSTGGCPSGCAAGYTGEDCYTQCGPGTYGEDCNRTCSDHCVGETTSCNYVNCTCDQGCEKGYLMPLCTEKCPNTTFGQNCEESCNTACLNIECDHENGACDNGCVDGYIGDFCEQECSPGTYGKDCDRICSEHCAGDANLCNYVNGTCTQGCDAGYLMPLCEDKCSPGSYGKDCNRICSDHCAGDTNLCNYVNGTCTRGCDAGYLMPLCEDKCSPGSYGSDCEGTCSEHCAGDANLCNYVDGTCDQGCDAGYLMPLCEDTCEDGKYGVGCNETCSSNCALSTNICNPVNGACIGGCGLRPGYRPPLCKEQCLPGTYGIDCAQTCSNHCAGQNAICDILFGVCEFGCDPGYQTVQCDMRKYKIGLPVHFLLREIIFLKFWLNLKTYTAEYRA